MRILHTWQPLVPDFMQKILLSPRLCLLLHQCQNFLHCCYLPHQVAGGIPTCLEPRNPSPVHLGCQCCQSLALLHLKQMWNSSYYLLGLAKMCQLISRKTRCSDTSLRKGGQAFNCSTVINKYPRDPQFCSYTLTITEAYVLRPQVKENHIFISNQKKCVKVVNCATNKLLMQGE